MSNEMENQRKIEQLMSTLKSLAAAEKGCEFSSVIKSLAEFIALKNDVLVLFEEQTKKPLNSQFLGKIFLDVELRTILFTYCKRHCDLMDFLNRNNEAVQKMISLRNIDLKEMVVGLSLVFRHVDKYANILQEIERNTPDGHPDKGNLYRASLVYADFYAECELIRKQREAQIYFMHSEILEENFGKDFEHLLGPIFYIGKVTVTESDQMEEGTEEDRCVAIFGRALLLVKHCSSTGKIVLTNRFTSENMSIQRENSSNSIHINMSSEKEVKFTLRTIGRDEYKQLLNALKNCEGIQLGHDDGSAFNLNAVQQPNTVGSTDGTSIATGFCNIRLDHQLEMILPGEDFSENVVSEVSAPSVRDKLFSGWSLRSYPPHRAEWLPNVGQTAPVKLRKGLSAEEQEDALMLKIIEGYCVTGASSASASCNRRAHDQRNSAESFHSPCGGGPVRRAASYPDQHEMSNRPQLIVAEDEKLFVEELEGDQFVVRERSLVDTVYSLKDQISVLTKELSKIAKALEQEQRTRRRLEEMVIRQTATGTVKQQNIAADPT
uniref:Rho guanine nucleotide exchange factor 6/7 coiled-coil domain-containing protein n=1 Tax=Globodera rostochiensis TaxID=31243 RepID=A0A914GUB7_GLORO